MFALASHVTKETKAQSCISMTLDSVCRLSPAVAHQKPAVRCSSSNLPDSHLDSPCFFFSFLLLSQLHSSPLTPLIRLQPLISLLGAGPRLFGCVLSKYTRGSGRPDDESITLRNVGTHGRHFISRTISPSLYSIVIFICLS